jgi:hypothetical protein
MNFEENVLLILFNSDHLSVGVLGILEQIRLITNECLILM